MKQKQFLTMKFNSDRLKKFKYNITLTLDEAIRNKEIISTFESQIIDSILSIKDSEIDYDELSNMKHRVKTLKKLASSEQNSKLIKELQESINSSMFVPEYITIKMIHKSHYKYLFEKGLLINGVKYKRFNASAGQARVNTVLFISEVVFDELRRRLDNGRDLSKPLVPAKLNAYRGLYSSSRFKVSTPRFCVVPDYFSPSDMKVNFVEETEWTEDDDIVIKDITMDFNRFDGQGLISPTLAKKWSNDLELDYLPSQFCIRGSFLKGMVCVFDFHEWIERHNDGNYIVDSLYKDENDIPIQVDLRDVDIIITESQMKLWDSWKSVEDYNMNCELNGLSWGVSLYTPKQDKNFFYQNYQFLQTLNLNDEDVKKITSKFVNWIKGVTSENVYYTMLFLLGQNMSEQNFLDYIQSSTNYWIKALIIEPELIKDKYIRNKVYQLLKKKITDASLGQIIVDGNFQVIVSDPYAQMQGVTKQNVTGLLSEGEYYSNYWNEQNVNTVVASRSPLTFRSEHVVLDLKKDKYTEDWFRYCKSGIILNAHGDDTARFAGSDFDYDIIATTSDESVIKGVYRDELPVVYEEPKPSKMIVTEQSLYDADKFSFDSIIGGLTNKSTSAYALLSELSPNTEEYQITLKRIKAITKAQSAQIDKTKIGREVKGIVGKWINYSPIPRDSNGDYIVESEEDRHARELNNRILLKKHPYFFTHLYSNTRRNYKNHVKQYNMLSLQKLGITLDELKTMQRKNTDQEKLLDEFYYNSPVLESDCVMNKICRRIESVDFEIKNLLRDDSEIDVSLLLNHDFKFDEDTYKLIEKVYLAHNKNVNQIMNNTEKVNKNAYNKQVQQEINIMLELFKSEINNICSNEVEASQYLIHLFYIEKNKSNKDLLWNAYGNVIVKNLKSKNSNTINIPIEDSNGELEYLNTKYTIREVRI